MKPEELLQKIVRSFDILIEVADAYDGLFPSLLDRQSHQMLAHLPEAIPGQRQGDRSHPGSNPIHDEAALMTMYASPCWQRTGIAVRCRPTTPHAEENAMQPLEISADFECANAEEIERLGDAEFALATRPDRAVDNEHYEMADYYVACRLINPNPEPVEATVTYRELAYPESGRTLAVRNLFPGRPPRVEDWIPLPSQRLEIDAVASTCRVRVAVAAEMSLDVSSMYWMSASQVYERLRQVEGSCRVGSLGKTAQGRDIPIVELTDGNRDAPLGVVAATPQSHELGTVAVMGILEAALAGKLDALSGRCRLALLPLTNPDGNALGTCMTNSLRQNVIFGFGRAGSGQAAAECEAVWNYLVETRPCFLLEYHSYPHLNRPSFRPYDLDLRLFPDEESRKQGEIFFAAICRISPNPGVRLEMGSDIEKQFRPSLISRLVTERGIPATLYKLHNRETVDDNIAHAIQVLDGVVTALYPEG